MALEVALSRRWCSMETRIGTMRIRCWCSQIARAQAAKRQLADPKPLQRSRNCRSSCKVSRKRQESHWTLAFGLWLSAMSLSTNSFAISRLRMSRNGQISLMQLRTSKKRPFWQSLQNTGVMRWSCLKSSVVVRTWKNISTCAGSTMRMSTLRLRKNIA